MTEDNSNRDPDPVVSGVDSDQLKGYPTDDIQRAYRVEELTTEGWSVVDPRATQLPRQEAKNWLDYMLNEGRPPNSLRAVPERPVSQNYDEKIKAYEEKLKKPNVPEGNGKNVTINVDKNVNVTINET
mgnify:CR=1 FL=1|tara:strand:+ start:1406 stop:1789 length:384 start_codon:yes stop_codon:yes gene_type:complete